jgi:hypothetical protein
VTYSHKSLQREMDGSHFAVFEVLTAVLTVGSILQEYDTLSFGGLFPTLEGMQCFHF